MKLLRLRLGKVTLLMWVEKPGASSPDLPGTVFARLQEDLDKNKPGQSCTPFSKSQSMNSALERVGLKAIWTCVKTSCSVFLTRTIKFSDVLSYGTAFQVNYLNITAALSFTTLPPLLWATLLGFSF